ncbi:putative nucleotide-diphospho-sugar transferase [Pararhizobium mangrovi]|uniref:Nucleotide-diphospho-sugar transferase domain-containing protein n=1 Tax=Pararhizobium mangrovi TaxID=2590452 RepID=A0A506U2F0_9HYPH|nr:putative nucleotide-diphospho-sugar transferase [Pararhizobium mangrovi]TPW27970.1 hypothetical protein FJU11_10530 [Pararhizobium mangrovi]
MAREDTDPTEGFVLAASGEGHAVLAQRAARTLREAMPECVIDLFTDQNVDKDVFDGVFALERSWFRPKMESLRRSRFERTIYLDNDVIVLSDLSEIFQVLTRFDMTGVQMIRTNWKLGRVPSASDVPPCFPQINGGVLGIASSARTRSLVDEWERRLIKTGAKNDQPILRDLLWTGDVRFHVLPPQYNMMSHKLLANWDSSFAAPRVLHLGAKLKADDPGDVASAYDLDTLIGRTMAEHIRDLRAADPNVGGNPKHSVPPLSSAIPIS